MFWLKKCNVALARGDEEAACLALRTGISRKAQPTEELSEKLKELVTMKMNEAIEASEKIEEAEVHRRVRFVHDFWVKEREREASILLRR